MPKIPARVELTVTDLGMLPRPDANGNEYGALVTEFYIGGALIGESASDPQIVGADPTARLSEDIAYLQSIGIEPEM